MPLTSLISICSYLLVELSKEELQEELGNLEDEANMDIEELRRKYAAAPPDDGPGKIDPIC